METLVTSLSLLFLAAFACRGVLNIIFWRGIVTLKKIACSDVCMSFSEEFIEIL